MPNLSPDAQQKISQLKREYVASLPKKLAILDENWQKIIDGSFEMTHLELLRTHSHKLAGSAGSYGLDKISNTARSLEELCLEILRSTKTQQEIIKSIGPCYQKLVVLVRQTSK